MIAMRRCRVCGCTDLQACEGGCWWIEDDLCSSCVAASPVDRVIVERLARRLLEEVNVHFQFRPQGRATVYEILNALAFVVGNVLVGTRGEALAWFQMALGQNLAELMRAAEAGELDPHEMLDG